MTATKTSPPTATDAAGWRHLTRPVRQLASELLAQSCALCHLPSGAAPLCAACAQTLPTLPPDRCERCALPLLGGLTHCPDCARQLPGFDAALAVWVYDFPVDTLIRDFKYGHHLYLGRFFGECLAQMLAEAYATQPLPDLVLPLPLHPNRLKTRGFNQAAELARPIARRLKLPCELNTLVRLHDTPPQAAQSRDQRWRNLAGAFACLDDLTGRHVLLVDDVLTTGASLSACADALRHAGAARVSVAVLARTAERDGHV